MTRRLAKASSVMLSGALLLGLLLSACGNNLITIKLDMASFMDEESRTIAIDMTANAPGLLINDFPAPVSTILKPEGLDEIITLEEMTIDFQMDLTHEITTALAVGDTVRLIFGVKIYISDDPSANELYAPENESENLFVQIGPLELNATETPDTTHTDPIRLEVNDRFLGLFQGQNEVYLGLQITFGQTADSAIGELDGNAITQDLRLEIVGNEDLF
jgi:hypothetical protein